MNTFEQSEADTAGWFAHRFEEKLEPGDLVFVQAYGRRTDTSADSEWQCLRDLGYVGTVSGPPTVTNTVSREALEDGITVTPYVPEPAGDEYASGHPSLVARGEKTVMAGGRSFVVRHTVELITPDGFGHYL